MFDKNSKISCHKYSIDISKPIGFICNLANEIASVSVKNYKLKSLFKSKFVENELNINTTEWDDTLIGIQEISIVISEYLTKKIFDKINIENSDILLIHKSANVLMLYKKDPKSDVKKSTIEFIKNIIYNEKIFEKVTSLIKNKKLRDCLTNSINVQYRELFDNCVEIKEPINIDLPFFKESILDFSKVEKNIIDENDLLLNTKRLKKYLNLDISISGETEVNVIEISNEDSPSFAIGLVLENIVFTTTPLSITEYIKPPNKLDYYWGQIRYMFSKEEERKQLYNNELLKVFRGKMEDSELSKVLSHLKNNIYVNEEVVEAESTFAEFFDEVYRIDELKYLDDYSFFVSSTHGKTALGIYTSKRNEENTSYNLLHWGMNVNGMFTNFRDNQNPETKKLTKVKALKPELSFYLVSKYFEDLLELAIQKSSCEYIKNFHLYVNSKTLGEIDFIIKSNTKLIIIEAKTKLTKEYIEAFQYKANNLTKSFSEFDIEVDFYIISAFSDEKSCEALRYFIDESEKENYNKKRAGLYTIPYYFTVPIQEQRNKRITCIAEPEFENLKSIIENICQM